MARTFQSGNFSFTLKGAKLLSSSEKAKLRLLAQAFAEVSEYFLFTRLKFKNIPLSLTVALVDDKKIKKLNKDYRKKDRVTDVLSFPIFGNLRGDSSELQVFPEAELGDIVISVPVAKSQAKEFCLTTPEELLHLWTHGFLHLLGFDHELSAKEEALMEDLEEELVIQVGLIL